MKYVLITLLKAYRLVISPLYGNVCRYYPSCSAYTLRAVEFHGAVKGTWYGARRLLRCHPWAAGGYDPVPGTPEFEAEMRDQAAAAVTMEWTPVSLESAEGDRADAESTRESVATASPTVHRDRGEAHVHRVRRLHRSPGVASPAAQARGVN